MQFTAALFVGCINLYRNLLNAEQGIQHGRRVRRQLILMFGPQSMESPMIATKTRRLLIAIAALVLIPTLHGEDSPKSDVATVIALADLGPEHDGKEVTMIFKITDTQLIGG